ncbi:zinc finger protein 85-like isoform X2 [Crassostrea angulata]|uniref:zinc finger protein 85-like isoform X2 n=1 Tax=Magallana angulata TaxID=2784310 RepID=UPI0022B1A0E7|nr:zinc finger protein 85-like isoform X2 [Crassostrea angulata]
MDEVCSCILTLCEMLDMTGHAALIMSVDWKNQKLYHCGAGAGRNFLLKNKSALTNFVKFCSDISGECEKQENVAVIDIEPLLKENSDQDSGEWQKDLCKGSVNSRLNVTEFESSEHEGQDFQDHSGDESYTMNEECVNKAPVCESACEKSTESLEQVLQNTESSPKSKEEKTTMNGSKEIFNDLTSTEKKSIGDTENLSLRRSARKRKDQDNSEENRRRKVENGGKTVKGDSSQNSQGTVSSPGNQCVFCNKKLRNWSTLIRHVASHAGRRSRCRICNEVCNKTVDLQAHIKTHRSEKKSPLNGVTSSKHPKGLSEISSETKTRRNGSGETVMNKICSLCQVEFSSHSNLKRHMKCHNSLKMFKCYVCSVNFRTEQELSSHAASHQVSLVHYCRDCGQAFMSETDLQFHEKESYCKATAESNEANFKCQVCNQEFYCQENYEKHLELHTKNPDTRISAAVLDNHDEVHASNGEENFNDLVQKNGICSENAQAKTNAKSTSEDKTIPELDETPKPAPKFNKTDLACELCGQTFKMAMNLYRHKLEHDNNGMFPCRFCNYVAKTKENLTRHSKKHLAQLPHICKICGRGFTEKGNLNAHMWTHSKEKQFLCDDCGKSFQNKQSLLSHKRAHSGKKPHKCKFCDQHFSTSGIRKEHEKIHLNKRSYMCDSCGMSFNQRSGLYTHKLTHHNNNPAHICSECGKAFKHPNYLRSHFVAKHLKHEDIASYGCRIYTCEICQKLFSDKSDLRSHMNKHTGEKPFKCAICNKGFSDKSNMRAHQRLHQDSRPHHCNVCGKGFLFNRDLKKHLNSHTPQSTEEAEKSQESDTAVEYLKPCLITADAVEESVQVQLSPVTIVGDFQIHASAEQDFMFQ